MHTSTKKHPAWITVLTMYNITKRFTITWVFFQCLSTGIATIVMYYLPPDSASSLSVLGKNH